MFKILEILSVCGQSNFLFFVLKNDHREVIVITRFIACKGNPLSVFNQEIKTRLSNYLNVFLKNASRPQNSVVIFN